VRLGPLVPAIAAAAALVVPAAGCGGSSSRAAATTSSRAGGTGTTRALSAADRAQFEKYRTCLEKHGFSEFGRFGANGRPPGTGTTAGQAPTFTGRGPTLTPAQEKARQKALSACRSLLPSGFQFGRAGASQGGRQGSQFAAYRACMRQHGVTLGAPGSTQQPSFDSKKFQAATKACGHLLVQAGQGTTGTATTTRRGG
jgi:hypothetical protein